MKRPILRELLVALLLLLAFRPFQTVRVLGSLGTEEAYVTLLYGDEFLLGARVLGKSIRETGSTKDMVVLVSDGVSEYAKKLLQADGWLVEHISLLENPNQVRPRRFWGVYTKLKIFNLIKYKKIVYLDADTIVVQSIEDLFKCEKFCANLKHSERLNSGVMVVEPSAELFNDMISKVKTTFSYTGGDQGFLNSYFDGFANAHIFEPNSSHDEMNSRKILNMERLPTLYNADVGLYMLANKWMVNESELRIIHYTLGPLKPWDWWTSWLVKPVDVWQNVRDQLEETLPGTRGGKSPKDDIVVKFLILFPVILFLCYHWSSLQTQDFASFNGSALCDHCRHLYYKFKSGGALSFLSVTFSISASNSNQQSKVPIYLGGASVFICFVTLALSVVLAFMVVPRQVTPWTGLLLLYESTFTIFFSLFRGYLHLIHQWGKKMATHGSVSSPPESFDYDFGKGHQQPLSSCSCTSLFYWLGMAFLAIAIPSLPSLFGITPLFLKLGLMAGVGVVWASFMTYAAEHLSIGSFLRGIHDGANGNGATRVRTMCCLC